MQSAINKKHIESENEMKERNEKQQVIEVPQAVEGPDGQWNVVIPTSERYNFLAHLGYRDVAFKFKPKVSPESEAAEEPEMDDYGFFDQTQDQVQNFVDEYYHLKYGERRKYQLVKGV